MAKKKAKAPPPKKVKAKAPAKKAASTKTAGAKKVAKTDAPEERERPKRTDMLHLRVDQLVVVEGFNVRKDMGDIDGLAASIAKVGIKVPLRGHLIKTGDDAGKYGITNGHRRYEAAQIVVKKNPDLLIPFQPEAPGYSDEDRTLDLLITNDGKPLTMLEQAEVIKRMISFGWERQDIAEKIGKTDQHVADLETLLTASSKLKKLVQKNEVSASALVETIRAHEGDMEKVEGALVKAQVKAGGEGKKIKPKHIDKPKKKGKPTLADLKDLRPELEASKPEGKGGPRLETYDLIVAYLSGEESNKTFLDKFYESRRT